MGNNHKQPGGVEAPLIMHQLTCNGVLEGIRICMRGFPNRMLYPDIKSRYTVLGGGKVDEKSSDLKKVAAVILENTEGFDKEKYRLGHTKVFFRAGALALLEEKRDDIVQQLIRKLQGACIGYGKRKVYAVKAQQREFIMVIQRNFRKYVSHRDWPWFTIIQKTKPLIGQVNLEEELRILEEKANEAYGAYKEQLDTKARLLEENVALKEDIKATVKELEEKQGNMSQYTERQAKATAAKADLEKKLEAAGHLLIKRQEERDEANADKKTLEGETSVLRKNIEDLELAIQKLEQEKTNRDH